jgi:hypothetical protein
LCFFQFLKAKNMRAMIGFVPFLRITKWKPRKEKTPTARRAGLRAGGGAGEPALGPVGNAGLEGILLPGGVAHLIPRVARQGRARVVIVKN